MLSLKKQIKATKRFRAYANFSPPSPPPQKNYKTLAFQSISSQKNKSISFTYYFMNLFQKFQCLEYVKYRKELVYMLYLALLFALFQSIKFKQNAFSRIVFQCSMKIIVQKEKKNNQTPQMKNVQRKETKHFYEKINIIMNNIMNKSF